MDVPRGKNVVWDREAAVKRAQGVTQSSSRGKCGTETRQHVEAGGIILPRFNSAKQYGLSLMAVGFVPLTSDPGPGRYRPGDVVVIQGFGSGKASSVHGHMAMFDGKKWVSDFRQSGQYDLNGIYPGLSYKQNAPSYTIYRYGIQWDSAAPVSTSNLA